MTYMEAYDKILPPEKRREEKFNVFVALVVRPLSVLMTLPLIKTKIKPTTITKISIIFLLCGFILLSIPQTLAFKLAGWLCMFIWALLDGVDGNLARCTDRCSSLGDLWDTMGGYIAMVLMNFSAGIAAFYDKSPLPFCDNYILLILGSFAAIFSIFPRLIMHKKKSSVGNSQAVKAVSDKKNFGIVNIIAMNIVSPSGFMQLLFLIGIVLHILNWFVLGYFIVNFGIMILSLQKLLKE